MSRLSACAELPNESNKHSPEPGSFKGITSFILIQKRAERPGKYQLADLARWRLFQLKRGSLREIPPIMVLSEENSNCITFRFKGNRWAWATLIPGLVLVALAGKLYLSDYSPNWLLLIVGGFGLSLIYSSLYSATADQWLSADADRKTIRFYKKNLYGLVDWERPAQDFLCIKVGRSIRSSSWHIVLVDKDGFELNLGENAFGALTLEKALNLAGKISSKTGIAVKSSAQAN